jgi:hypothetical protein
MSKETEQEDSEKRVVKRQEREYEDSREASGNRKQNRTISGREISQETRNRTGKI